ncbi:uncharacterized protein LOC117213654 isoform X1 [Bombus bifarius]|uniref:Uncharacterized protein LOC117213654 isoform X1 n=1 Tax=Bombus bifarius TaxID=103933 RepID=A0A6P8MML9_9HYME|nr:uncharacterized protein LOC117213654 isoform X1 [Bombus bifarius]
MTRTNESFADNQKRWLILENIRKLWHQVEWNKYKKMFANEICESFQQSTRSFQRTKNIKLEDCYLCALLVVSVACNVAVLYVIYHLYRHIYYEMDLELEIICGELSDMYFCYGAASCNSTKAQCLYDAKYPNRTIPSTKIFCKIVQRSPDTD